jgi:alpha-1,2-mannosyltransferase
LLWLYSFCGRFADQHSANGTWTFNHITKLWGTQNVALIYPPCDTSDIVRAVDLMGVKKNIIVSFAQFRPEKDHHLQLRVWCSVIKKLPTGSKFIMIGATRGKEDEDLVDELKKTAFDLGISSSVEIWENKPRTEIVQLFSQAKVAIHTMKEEHFGISVVEMMAAGLVTIAHNSAGPMLDIIGKSEQVVGYLCDNEADYAVAMERSMNKFGDSFTLALR